MKTPLHRLIVAAGFFIVALTSMVVLMSRDRRVSGTETRTSAVREGLRIAFALNGALAEFTITDASSGKPVSGLRPLAWMSRRATSGALEESVCKSKIKSYVGGLLSAQPEIDLNSFMVLTLNDDDTISVINPQVSFSKTQLRALLRLPGKATHWVARPDAGQIYIAIPGRREIAVVDTTSYKLRAPLVVGVSGDKLALSPDGATLWVASTAARSVSAFDTSTRKLLGRLPVDAGPHEMVFSDEGRRLWVGGPRGNVLYGIDVGRKSIVERISISGGLSALASSAFAGAVYAASVEGKSMHRIDARAGQSSRMQTIALKNDISAMAFDPTGRWLFAASTRAGAIDIFDAALGSIRHKLLGFNAPDGLSFTSRYAYVRNAGDTRLSLIELGSLSREATPGVTQVQVGQSAQGAVRGLSNTQSIAVTPEGNSVIVAQPTEQALYYYVEGMMAPLGTLRNYGRKPRAALAVNGALKEIRPGVYATSVRPQVPGPHDVAFLLREPRASLCLETEVPTTLVAEENRSRNFVTFASEGTAGTKFSAGARAELRFTVSDGIDKTPIGADEISVVVFRTPAGRHWRPEPVARGAGSFKVVFTPDRPGQYKLAVGVDARGAPLGALQAMTFGVKEKVR